MSLGLHAAELPRSGSGLLARGRVFEPQNVRNQGGVAQQQKLRDLPRHDIREEWRQPLGEGEPNGAEHTAQHRADNDLGPCVVLQVDAAEANDQCGQPTEYHNEEAHCFFDGRVVVHVVQSQHDKEHGVGGEETHELCV
jgi:hypothetical protein